MRSYIQLVATGPELSKSLTRAQADDGMGLILGGQIDPVRSAIFLIALRMKRETDDENLGALDALVRAMEQRTVASPDIVALADPFNGYLRGLPATPFVPAVLAACGLPCYLHGVHSAGPKYGVTSHQVLAAAGKPVDYSVVEAGANLDNEGIGWAYLDQARYHPALHRLIALRDQMVKRCLVSTLEVVLNPLRGAERSHLLTGFVHKAYPPVYQALARHAGFDSAAIIRGVEGGCVPSLSQLSRFYRFDGDSDLSLSKLDPGALGISRAERSIAIPDYLQPLMEKTGWQQADVLEPVAKRTAELGLEALQGNPGAMYDSLIYVSAIALCHVGRFDAFETAAAHVRETIDSGQAIRRFEAG